MKAYKINSLISKELRSIKEKVSQFETLQYMDKIIGNFMVESNIKFTHQSLYEGIETCLNIVEDYLSRGAWKVISKSFRVASVLSDILKSEKVSRKFDECLDMINKEIPTIVEEFKLIVENFVSKLDDNDKWELEVAPSLAQVAHLLSMEDKVTKGLKELVASFILKISEKIHDNVECVSNI